MHRVKLVGLDLDASVRQLTLDRDRLEAALRKLRRQRLFVEAGLWSAMPWPTDSTAHHTGAKRPYSTVSEPAVDTTPAQHHVFSFPPQFVGMRFVGARRRGAYDFGGAFGGASELEPTSPQQILEEGFRGLILTRRGRRPEGGRRARNLKALRLGRGTDHYWTANR